MNWLIIGFVYGIAAMLLDKPTHEEIYPMVGWGYPMTGHRRWLLRIFCPIVWVCLWSYRGPIVLLIIIAMMRRVR